MLKEKYLERAKITVGDPCLPKNRDKHQLSPGRKSQPKIAVLSVQKPSQTNKNSPRHSNWEQVSAVQVPSRYSSTIETTKSRKSVERRLKDPAELFKLPSIGKKLEVQEPKDAKSAQKREYSYEENSYGRPTQELEGRHVKMGKANMKQYPISIRTKAGCNGKIIKINQDMDVIHQKLPHGFKLFCICDGHGANGHQVVSFLKRRLLSNIKNCLAKLEDLAFFQQEMYLALLNTNNQLLQSEINTELSGATVLAVFLHEDKVICFNVGDSRAIMINYQYQQLKAQPISQDHKPQREDEARRILAAGGRIEKQINDKKQYVGPLRVWIKDLKSPGLAMTRSFGDKAGNRAGTTGEPQITQFSISQRNKYLLIASDGVWEHIQNSEIPKYLESELKAQLIEEAADKLLKIAVEQWDSKYSCRDDITFILVKLNSFRKQNLQ